MAYKPIPHKPVKRTGLPWLLCNACGLIFLGNPFSAWAIRLGCNHEEHPDYPRMWRTLGGLQP
jgi:hypothetical protein